MGHSPWEPRTTDKPLLWYEKAIGLTIFTIALIAFLVVEIAVSIYRTITTRKRA